jgi:hypothetical protein
MATGGHSAKENTAIEAITRAKTTLVRKRMISTIDSYISFFMTYSNT